MPRSRRQSESSEFGSDSFLDIVANIVGILIILIVIAGVRMSQSPPIESEQTPVIESFPVVENDVAPPIELPVIQLGHPAVDQDNDLPIPFTVSLGPATAWPIERDPDHSQKLTSGKSAIEQNEGILSTLLQTQLEVENQIGRQQESINKNQMASSQAELTYEKQREDLTQLEEALAQQTNRLANLSQQLVVLQREAKPAEALEHRIVPVSQVVRGHEWHFEVRARRVTFIPLDDLIAQLKVQVQRRSDWLAKFHTHEGVIGPFGNFAMEYKVSRKNLSLAEELTHGRGMFRIGIDRWELVPVGEKYGESALEARHPHSEFRQHLNRASFEDAITLWVYPDSFELYRELVKIAHELGHQVAARPLPLDRRIAGSPHGSKSVSQ